VDSQPGETEQRSHPPGSSITPAPEAVALETVTGSEVVSSLLESSRHPSHAESFMKLDDLKKLVQGAAVAVRVRQRLQPAGGPGDKVFPPTYATGDNKLKYVVEPRRIDGHEAVCVLLDSVASQANRIEEALLEAWRRKELSFPVMGVDFASADPALADLGTITALETPHRIADAILRDSLGPDGKTLFRDTPEGQAYTDATPRDSTAVFRLCPTALSLGVWDSTGPKGGLGAKFQRTLTSEIVAIHANMGSKVGSRLDPLAIPSSIEIYHRADDESDWTLDPKEAKIDKGKPALFTRAGGKGKGKPSSINHSNIAPTKDDLAGGITFDYAVQTVVLSLPALRKLRFRTGYDGKPLPNVETAEAAARTALAALALAGIVHLREKGYDLRSRCLLIPESAFKLEVVAPDGSVKEVGLDVPTANSLLAEAAAAAKAAGLPWEREPLTLKPAPKLVALVKRGRELHAAGEDAG
jgi:CRISPR-associated protein Csb1